MHGSNKPHFRIRIGSSSQVGTRTAFPIPTRRFIIWRKSQDNLLTENLPEFTSRLMDVYLCSRPRTKISRRQKRNGIFWFNEQRIEIPLFKPFYTPPAQLHLFEIKSCHYQRTNPCRAPRLN